MGTMTNQTNDNPNFSIKRILSEDILEIPVYQQMVVVGDLAIEATGELVLNATSDISCIQGTN